MTYSTEFDHKIICYVIIDTMHNMHVVNWNVKIYLYALLDYFVSKEM